MAVMAKAKLKSVEREESEKEGVSTVGKDLASKLGELEARLKQLGSLMVAYSGGVDSAFLAATAHRVLGDRMLAVLADSPSLARRDMEQACVFARDLKMPLHVIKTEELERPEYQRNDANRCFHCRPSSTTSRAKNTTNASSAAPSHANRAISKC